MKSFYTERRISAVDAKFEANKIAFAPVVFQATKVMRDLGILDLIFDNQTEGISLEEIAKTTDITLYGTRVLLEMGLSADIVKLSEEENYKLTKTGYFLLKDEMTRINMDFVQDVCYEGLFHLEEAIKKTKPSGLKVFGKWKTVYEALAHLPEKVTKSWFAFDHFYSDGAFPEALPIVFKNKPKRLLDVGGNTGKFSMQCARYDEDVQLTILDLPGQWEKAKGNIEAQGLANRITGHPIDLLSANPIFPKGAGAIWMSQFLDCFSEEEIVHILTAASNGMNDDTELFIMETYWDRQQFDAATYCLHGISLYFTAIANGNSRMYHADTMKECCEKAGLQVVEEIDHVGQYHTIFRCKLTSSVK